MRSIFKIIKLEFRLLFYSPVAWVVLILFTIRMGSNFSTLLQSSINSANLGNQLGDLTAHIYNPMYGLYNVIRETLLLGLPFLSMGIMSRERSSGTIKLLQSAPLTSWQVVLGKFFSLMIYAMGFILILFVLMLTSGYAIVHQDNGLLVAGFLSVFLLVAIYSAIGLFMSSLTAYQIIAAISSVVVFAALDNMRLLWSRFKYLQDVTWFLDMRSKLIPLEQGYLISGHVFYFIIITILFLVLLKLRLDNARRTRSWQYQAVQYTTVVAVALLSGVLTMRPHLTFYIDFTQSKRHTLTDKSKAVVAKIHDPVVVHSFGNMLDGKFEWVGPAAGRHISDRFRAYERYLPSFSYTYTYFYDSVENPELFDLHKGESLKEVAEIQSMLTKFDFSRLMSPDSIRRITDLQPEENRTHYQLECGGRKANLRLYEDNMGLTEENITAAFKQLTGTVQTIGFLTGHGERSINQEGDSRNYRRFSASRTYKWSLLNLGLNCTEVDLAKGPVPPGLQALVIADPDTVIKDAELALLRQYIDAGGNLVVMAEPGKQELLNPVVERLGVKFLPGSLVQRSLQYGPTTILGKFTPAGLAFVPAVQQVTRVLTTEMPDAVALAVDSSRGFTVDVIAESNGQDGWNTQHKVIPDTTGKFDPFPDDQRGAFPLAIKMLRRINGREQRIFVAGDADFVSNASVRKANPMETRMPTFNGNWDLQQALFRWMSTDEFPVDITRPEEPDNALRVGTRGGKIIRWTLLYIIPGLLVLWATVLIVRRNRK